jgi:hypothetical protein
VNEVNREPSGGFIDTVRRELEKLGVKFEVLPIGQEWFRQFNLSFLLALDCYMPSVAQALFKDCRVDIKMFGFEYAQKKWSRFIVGSLTGKGDKSEAVS